MQFKLSELDRLAQATSRMEQAEADYWNDKINEMKDKANG